MPCLVTALAHLARAADVLGNQTGCRCARWAFPRLMGPTPDAAFCCHGPKRWVSFGSVTYLPETSPLSRSAPPKSRAALSIISPARPTPITNLPPRFPARTRRHILRNGESAAAQLRRPVLRGSLGSRAAGEGQEHGDCGAAPARSLRTGAPRENPRVPRPGE